MCCNEWCRKSLGEKIYRFFRASVSALAALQYTKNKMRGWVIKDLFYCGRWKGFKLVHCFLFIIKWDSWDMTFIVVKNNKTLWLCHHNGLAEVYIAVSKRREGSWEHYKCWQEKISLLIILGNGSSRKGCDKYIN